MLALETSDNTWRLNAQMHRQDLEMHAIRKEEDTVGAQLQSAGRLHRALLFEVRSGGKKYPAPSVFCILGGTTYESVCGLGNV